MAEQEKQPIGTIKMKIPAGGASAAPPVGSTLGQYGVNMMDFINPHFVILFCSDSMNAEFLLQRMRLDSSQVCDACFNASAMASRYSILLEEPF